MNTLSYRRTGTPCSTPFVLLHALPLDSTMWEPMRAVLAERGADIDILTPDSPGFGNSGPGYSYSDTASLAVYAQALKSTLDSLGITRIVLGGLSMGGSVAAQFALLYPDMIAGLALMDTNIAADTEAQAAKRIAMAEQAEAGHGYQAVQEWPTSMLSPDAPDSVRENLDRRLQALPNEGLAWEQRAMASRPESTHAVELNVPILLLRGVHDPTCSREYLDSLADRANEANVIEIDRAAHFSALENPEQFAQAIYNFYTECN